MSAFLHARLPSGTPRCCWLVFVLSLSIPAFSAEPTLSLVQAQTIAVGRSRQLAAQDLSVLASQEMAVAGAQLPDPIITFGIDNLPINGAQRYSLTNDSMTMRKVGVMQELTSSDKRQARSALVERAADKARAEKTVTLAAIERDTALAWLSQYYAQKMLSTIKEQVAQNRLEIAAAQSAYRAGQNKLSDLFAARSALGLMEDKASELEQKLTVAKIALARWTGYLADIAADDLPVMDSIRLQPAQLDAQLAHHPQIAVVDQQIKLAQAEATLAQANKTPDWSVGLAYLQRSSAYSNMISVELSVPFQWDQKNRQNRELSAKLALVEQVRAQREELLRQHVEETSSMLSEWHNDRDRINRFDQELLPLAGQRIEAVLAGYRGGKATLTDLLAARRDEIELRLQCLQLQNDTARLWAQLTYLTPSELTTAMNQEQP